MNECKEGKLVCTFSPRTQETEPGGSLSCRIARATQRNHVSKTEQKKESSVR